MAPIPDPPNDENERSAVLGLRIFLPFYAAATATLFLPVLLRTREISSPVASYAATMALVLMGVSAPMFLMWLGRLGQYHARGGLKFQLIPALLDGEYVPLEGRLLASPSPLGATAADGARAAKDLDAAGLTGLAQTLRTAIAEAEVIQVSLARVALSPAEADPGLARDAEAALSLLRDRVVALQAGQRQDPGELGEALEGALSRLRDVNDRLRKHP